MSKYLHLKSDRVSSMIKETERRERRREKKRERKSKREREGEKSEEKKRERESSFLTDDRPAFKSKLI